MSINIQVYFASCFDSFNAVLQRSIHVESALLRPRLWSEIASCSLKGRAVNFEATSARDLPQMAIVTGTYTETVRGLLGLLGENWTALFFHWAP